MKVYFTGDFGEGDKNMQEGKLLDIKSVFRCNGHEWLVPAVYCFEEGISVDICKRIPVKEVMEFFEKWPRTGRVGLTMEQQDERRAADPFSGHCRFDLHVNGKKIRGEGWSKTTWYGTNDGREDEDAGEMLEAYELDRDSAWSFYRTRFCWPEGAEEIKTLYMTVTAYADTVPCGCRFTSAVGCVPFDVEFTHPVTSDNRRLHILSCTRARMDNEQTGWEPDQEQDCFIYPENYCRLEYREVTPDSPAGAVTVRDCARSDMPIRKETAESDGSAAMNIIGGARGVTVLTDSNVKIACSAMHFEEQQQVEWYVSAEMIPFEPRKIKLL